MTAASVYVAPHPDLGDGGLVGVRWGRGPLQVIRPDGLVVEQYRDLEHADQVSGPGVDETTQERLDEAEEYGREQGHAEGVKHARHEVMRIVDDVLTYPEVRALLLPDLGNAAGALRNELAERIEMALRTDS